MTKTKKRNEKDQNSILPFILHFIKRILVYLLKVTILQTSLPIELSLVFHMLCPAL